MGTTNVGRVTVPGKSPASKKVGIIAVAAIFLLAAIAVATTHRLKRSSPDDEPGNSSPVSVPTAARPAEVATDQPPVNHPPRRLQDVNRRELETTLPKGAPVEITAAEGDDDAFQLAEEIRDFLRSEKYPVTPVTRRAPDPSAKGVGLEPLPGGKWRVIVGAAE
jgi:hypothetical protein